MRRVKTPSRTGWFEISKRQPMTAAVEQYGTTRLSSGLLAQALPGLHHRWAARDLRSSACLERSDVACRATLLVAGASYEHRSPSLLLSFRSPRPLCCSKSWECSSSSSKGEDEKICSTTALLMPTASQRKTGDGEADLSTCPARGLGGTRRSLLRCSAGQQ